jgi:hypothetical protein
MDLEKVIILKFPSELEASQQKLQNVFQKISSDYQDIFQLEERSRQKTAR